MNQEALFYEIAGQELASQKVSVSIMSRAMADAFGDKDRASALYLRYRVFDLWAKYYEQLAKDAESNWSVAKADAWARLKREEEKAAQAERDRAEAELKLQKEAAHREYSRERWITVCPQCQFAGAFKKGFLAETCKCPKCHHKFQWYYSPLGKLIVE